MDLRRLVAPARSGAAGLFVALLAGCAAPIPAPQASPETRAATAQPQAADVLGAAGDEDLRLLYEKAWNERGFLADPRGREAAIDRVLLEAVRRRTALWERFLAQQADELLEPKTESLGSRSHLLVLTALRRLQGRPDPVEVLVLGPRRIELSWPPRHLLEVELALAPAEEKPVRIVTGGDYRSGWQERWRIEVLDSSGRTLPPRQRLDATGGLMGHALLEPGKSWKTALELGSYATLPGPGSYTARVEYHDRLCISHLEEVSGLILIGSEEIELVVRLPDVELSRGEREEVLALIEELDEQAPLRLLAGAYTGAHHDFIPPGSTAGRLLALGWKAVPELARELEHSRHSPRRRAWILALLFSITGGHDPRQDGVLGSYLQRSAAWSVSGGRDDPEFMSWGWTADHSVEGAMRPEAQEDLVERWRKTARALEVRGSD
jgi:hypothetical protein